jgi:hypothetical protein
MCCGVKALVAISLSGVGLPRERERPADLAKGGPELAPGNLFTLVGCQDFHLRVVCMGARRFNLGPTS